jgi:flagellar FliJ protein
MSERTLEPLQLLMQREQQHCDQAKAALRAADQTAERAQRQHEQLVVYRGEYEARWSGQFAQGSSMDILQCYRSFMQRLDQAVSLQTRQAELADMHLVQARHELMESERRLASVRKLIERRAAEIAHAGRQREQKQTDEQAQRMRWPNTQRDRLLSQ